jgi:phosphoesterase RecJ-like protein
LLWPLTWLDAAASSTGEMIFKFIMLAGLPIDRDMALCLYTAIFTDTGSFRYSNTSPECLRISATLLDAGADPWLVTEHVYESFSFNRLKLLGCVLSDMERSPDKRMAWVVVSEDLLRKTGTTSEDTDNFVNFVRSVNGVEVAILFRQTANDQYKISLRSKGRIDLSALAQALGGGGHKNAAGCTQDGTLEDIKRKVLTEVAKAILNQWGS